jgi:hypothetical protein
MSKIVKEKEFEFKLSEQILYQHQNGESKSDTLLLKSFSRNHMHRHQDNLIDMRDMLNKAYISFMKEMVVFSDMASKQIEETKETKTIKDDYVTFNLFLGFIPDKKHYNKIFWELIIDNLCFVDRKIALTKDLKDDISLDDQADILAEYTRNFILPSWMKPQFVK